MAKGKNKYTEMLRFRAPKAFKERVKAILEARGYGGESEILREAIIRHIEAEEKRLGLKPNKDNPPQQE